MTSRSSHSDWYFVASLATVTFLLICAGLAFNVVLVAQGGFEIRFPEPDSLGSKLLTFGVVISIVAMFWFWVRMLADYFRNRPPANAVAWGFCLLFFNFAAALVYFWRIWRPRNAPHPASAA